jgi:hypothetical protein
MQTKSILKICAALIALTLSQSSFAGGYWAIGGGTTSWNIKPVYGTFEVENGPTFDILLGLRKGNFAFEGEFTYSSHDWVGVSNATHNVGNLIFAGLGFLPIGQTFEIYGKLGVDFWKTTVDFGGANYDGDNSAAFIAGVGVNIKFTPTFNLRAEYKAVNGVGDGVDEGNLGQTTILAVFNF